MLHVSLSELSALGPWDVSICTIWIHDVIRLLVQVSRCRRIVSLESNKKPSLSTTIGCHKVVSQSHKLPTTLNHTSGMNWKNTRSWRIYASVLRSGASSNKAANSLMSNFVKSAFPGIPTRIQNTPDTKGEFKSKSGDKAQAHDLTAYRCESLHQLMQQQLRLSLKILEKALLKLTEYKSGPCRLHFKASPWNLDRVLSLAQLSSTNVSNDGFFPSSSVQVKIYIDARFVRATNLNLNGWRFNLEQTAGTPCCLCVFLGRVTDWRHQIGKLPVRQATEIIGNRRTTHFPLGFSPIFNPSPLSTESAWSFCIGRVPGCPDGGRNTRECSIAIPTVDWQSQFGQRKRG